MTLQHEAPVKTVTLRLRRTIIDAVTALRDTPAGRLTFTAALDKVLVDGLAVARKRNARRVK